MSKKNRHYNDKATKKRRKEGQKKNESKHMGRKRKKEEKTNKSVTDERGRERRNKVGAHENENKASCLIRAECSIV